MAVPCRSLSHLFYMPMSDPSIEPRSIRPEPPQMKIPRVSKSLFPPQPRDLERDYTRETLKGNTILFFGDVTIRSIYRDMSHLLQNGKQMSPVELSRRTNHTFNSE